MENMHEKKYTTNPIQKKTLISQVSGRYTKRTKYKAVLIPYQGLNKRRPEFWCGQRNDKTRDKQTRKLSTENYAAKIIIIRYSSRPIVCHCSPRTRHEKALGFKRTHNNKKLLLLSKLRSYQQTLKNRLTTLSFASARSFSSLRKPDGVRPYRCQSHKWIFINIKRHWKVCISCKYHLRAHKVSKHRATLDTNTMGPDQMQAKRSTADGYLERQICRRIVAISSISAPPSSCCFLVVVVVVALIFFSQVGRLRSSFFHYLLGRSKRNGKLFHCHHHHHHELSTPWPKK